MQNANIQQIQKDLEEAIRFSCLQYDDIVAIIEALEDKMIENTTIKIVQQEHIAQLNEVQVRLEETNRKLREKSVDNGFHNKKFSFHWRREQD